MGKGIKYSKKHGLNPSLLVCPNCGKDICIGLFGRINRNDDAMPMKTLGYLCDECKKDYTLFLEKDVDCPPTGRMFVSPKSSIVEEYRDKDLLFITSKTFNEILNNISNGNTSNT